jgi:hypothetical protein
VKTPRVWKVAVGEDGIVSDHWMVPAQTIEQAIARARAGTREDWDVLSAQLVEGDWLIPRGTK